ncbi:hypothetical protein MCGE09_00528 [Thaumarchaeota archaeon SCGC AB-539-E09]|nr:hypothetical protein MCGE09_00528 [Thaumarchaeota archaeon SCGC AB-539-E09]
MTVQSGQTAQSAPRDLATFSIIYLCCGSKNKLGMRSQIHLLSPIAIMVVGYFLIIEGSNMKDLPLLRMGWSTIGLGVIFQVVYFISRYYSKRR